MEDKSHVFQCHCPFCVPKKLLLAFSRPDIMKTWRIWITGILLLGRVVWAGEGEGGWEDTPPNKPSSEVSLYSQRIHINSTKDTECGSHGCHCYPTGRCKPCSRFEIARQIPECLLTGYRRLAYCQSLKKEMTISCHYEPNPMESRKFLLFEGVTVVIGMVSYSVVHFRRRRLELMVARRIQQQINA